MILVITNNHFVSYRAAYYQQNTPVSWFTEKSNHDLYVLEVVCALQIPIIWLQLQNNNTPNNNYQDKARLY